MEKKKRTPVRLQKYLSECGVASRRRAEEYIQQGRVEVNGTVMTELGTSICPERDIVRFDGRPVHEESRVYVMLHKPEGYVTTAHDEHGRPTVMELVGAVHERLVPVGRLDYNTSGLLIMTNDGELVYKLTHPKHEVEKSYIARVSGIPEADSLRRFARGLSIDGYKTAGAKIRVIKNDGGNSSLLITIHEGRNRQVRKMCEAIGHPVIHLKRVRTGKLSLGELEKGKYRHLTAEEIKYLKNEC